MSDSKVVKAALERPREVSCLALTFFYDYLKARGVDRRLLQEGLPYAPEFLDNRLNWIDYSTFLAIEARLAGLFPSQPDLYFNVGRAIGDTSGFGFLRVLIRAVVSPFQTYRRIPALLRRFLFPFVTITFERSARDSLRGHYLFDRGFEPSAAFLETVRGVLTGVPLMMGAPAPTVTMTRLSEREVLFDIALSKWLGPAASIAGFWRNLVGIVRMRRRNVLEAASELEETNHLLQEKVDALTVAQGELNQRVRDLSTLNALSRAASSELDVQRLLDAAVAVIGTELGRIPVAVLLGEGEPPGLLAAAMTGMSTEQQYALYDLGNPEAHETQAVLERRESAELVVAGRRLLLLPMVTGERVIGALVLGIAREDFDAGLLEGMASQLAVAVANAHSYQVINDLRDNLELRVKDRTNELEDARGKLEDTVFRLEHADRAKSEFFTNVNHELRTPLTLILAPLDDLGSSLARRPDLTHELARVQMVRRNAQGLLRLVNELLDFAKIDSDKMPMHLEAIDVGALAAELLESLRSLADRKNLRVAMERPSHVIAVDADSKLLRRVLLNLLMNAIKYVEEGDSVTVRVLDRDAASVVVEIADTGPGIPADEHARIFERFHRAKDARGRLVEGTGIGLAMVRDIVTRHHGTIELESELEVGSTFRIVLPKGAAVPLAPVQVNDAERRALSELLAGDDVPVQWAPPGSASGELRGTLLLVEDNPDMRRFMSDLLGRHYHVLVAENGQAALAIARRELPDLVLSDVNMPQMNGLEMCRLLKDDPATRNIPVVLVTSRNGTEAALEGFAAGADDFVSKPFSWPELLARIDAQVRIRALAMSLIRAEKQSSLGLMAAGIAHEVLNPVNAVVNAVAPIRRMVEKRHELKPDDADLCMSLLDGIEHSGLRIRDVVKAILTFARHDGELRLKESNLRTGIESVLAVLAMRVSDRVQVHLELGWEGRMVCYPELLNQVIMNLVANALDALGETGGNIWVGSERDGNTLRVTVRDDGPGVSPENRERIFQPFFTTKGPGSGTGLGLAISREITALHHGSLELSDTRTGAEFVLSLPLVDSLHEQPTATSASASLAS